MRGDRSYVEWMRLLAQHRRGPALRKKLRSRHLITGTESIIRCIELCFWLEGKDEG